MKLKLHPIGDQILIRRADPPGAHGKLVIPDDAREKQSEGVVLAVGPGRVLESGQIVGPGVLEGERVLFRRYAGDEITFNGEECVVLRETDVLGRVAEEGA